MSNQAIRDEFLDIVVWSRGAQRAPHKPLLILYALGALMRGQEKLGFIELEQPLRELLKEFGPMRQAYHPEYPFWRLRNDGVWLLDNAGHCAIRASNTDAKISELREHNVLGCFRPDIIQAFKADSLLLSDVVQAVLEAHFPDTLHSEILERCGIDLQYNKTTTKRDPAFRGKVLKAYQYRCAICDYQVQMDGRHLALEAAHIKWHAACGPDVESNGIAMCSLHHKLFDMGAFTVSEGLFVVSECVYGNGGLEHTLLRYHGRPIQRPIASAYMPLIEHFQWHEKEVFKGPARAAVTTGSMIDSICS